MMEVNEKLLEEKRELVQKIIEAEEMGSKAMKTASTVQYRYPQSLFTHVHDSERYEYYSFNYFNQKYKILFVNFISCIIQC